MKHLIIILCCLFILFSVVNVRGEIWDDLLENITSSSDIYPFSKSVGIRLYGGDIHYIESVDSDGTSPCKLSINPAGGYVGIGTSNPLGVFHVAGPRAENFYIGLNNIGHIIIGTDAGGNLNLKPRIDGQSVFVRDGNTQKGIRLYGGGMNYIESVDLDGRSPFHLSINPEGGNVGLGTRSPGEKLHVKGNVLVENGNVLVGNGNVLIENGKLSTKVLEITGGADLSEWFEVNETEEADPLSPGMVVSIDPDNIGDLVISREAYDRKVAGIISGSGDINPGIVMGIKQTLIGESMPDSMPVAMCGRVYCLVHTGNGSIEPGDLLTTSNIPGYAMKVTDYIRAQGAIIGKAMSSLDQERGLVLVLVTLQ